MDNEQYQGLAGFRYALRQFVAASEKLSRGAGITQQQYQALLAIKTKEMDDMSMGDLAEQLLLSHHGTVQLVDRLAKAGLVRRDPSTNDRRSVHVNLTEDGRVLLDELAAKHLQEMLRQEPLLRRSLQKLKKIGSDA